MADDDLTVRFGADTSELDAAVALAKVELAGLNDEVSSLAKAMTDAGQQSQAALLGSLQLASAEARDLKVAIADAEKSLAAFSRRASTAGLSAVADEMATIQKETTAFAKAASTAGLAAVASEMATVRKELAETAAATRAVGLAGVARELATIEQEMKESASLAHAAGLGAVARALAEVETSAKGAGAAFGSAGLTATYLTRETRALLDEAAAGRWRQFDGTVVNVATHFAQLAANFAATNPLVTAAGIAAVAAGGYFAYLGLETLRTAEVFTAFKNSLALSGQVSLTDQEITALSEKIRALAGVSHTEADEIVQSFGRMQNQSKAVFEEMADDIAQLTPAGSKAGQTAKELEALFANPFDAAERLLKLFGSLTDAERDLLRTADATGDIGQAQAGVAEVIQDHLQRERSAREQVIQASLAQAEAAREAMAAVGGEEGQAAFNMLTAQIEAWQKELAAIKAANDEAKKQAGILEAATSSAEVLRQRFDDVLKSIAPWTTELEKARAAAAAIGAALSGSTGDAATFIKQFEGFTPVAKPDTDGKFRVGYGSDTTTDASGQKHPVTATTTTTEEDADRDLQRRIVETQKQAADAIGPIWESLSAQVKVSITDLFYNYGNNIQRLSGVIAAAKTGDTTALAGAIGGLGGDNGGINARRRASEALNLTGAPAAVTDPARVAEGTEAIAEQNDKILSLTQAKSGGTEIDKAQIANLQATLAGRQDEIAATERLIAATQRQLELTSSTKEQTKLQAELDRERVTLKGQQNAAQEAQLQLAVGQARGAGNAAGERDAAVALAEFKMSLYGQDTAEYKRALGEKEAADRQYEATQKQVAEQSAQDQIRSIESATRAKIQEYDTDYRAHAISETKKAQLTEAALTDEITKEKAILDQELALENLRPQERKKILDQLTQLEQEYAQKVKQVQVQEADAALKAWQGFFAPMNSAINGFISEVVSGHETIRTALAKTLEKMTADLIKFFADWVLKQGELVVAHLAGNAAIQASDQASALGGVASMIASAIKAIAAGAGETAAGVSGFLAPVLGPAAVPAGLAAGAAISAGARGIAAFDVGAYDVPNNQLAMIHKNELVMPAPEAGAFRSLLSGTAQGGGGGGGGDTHIHNWNISGAQSPTETAKAVAKIMNSNPSLRPRY